MAGQIAKVFPEAAYQRCAAHFYRNAPTMAPKSKRLKFTAVLRAAHTMGPREASEAKAVETADKLNL